MRKMCLLLQFLLMKNNMKAVNRGATPWHGPTGARECGKIIAFMIERERKAVEVMTDN